MTVERSQKPSPGKSDLSGLLANRPMSGTPEIGGGEGGPTKWGRKGCGAQVSACVRLARRWCKLVNDAVSWPTPHRASLPKATFPASRRRLLAPFAAGLTLFALATLSARADPAQDQAVVSDITARFLAPKYAALAEAAAADAAAWRVYCAAPSE